MHKTSDFRGFDDFSMTFNTRRKLRARRAPAQSDYFQIRVDVFPTERSREAAFFVFRFVFQEKQRTYVCIKSTVSNERCPESMSSPRGRNTAETESFCSPFLGH